MEILNTPGGKKPSFFSYLMEKKLIGAAHILHTQDGFHMISKSLSSILMSQRIESFPDSEDRLLLCDNFFDDWYLYAVPAGEKFVYGLLKMREQEHDREKRVLADGDTPGVTVSFIAFDCDVMKECLGTPTERNRKKLGMEINRVVAYPKQKHHPDMKRYFVRPEAEAPYLIAQTYVKVIASLCKGENLPVPDAYMDLYKKRHTSKKYARVAEFLELNNRNANSLVCDHQNIFIRDKEKLSEYESLAILATHTGNVSVHSFAAEIRYHALFLTRLANIRIPLLGSPYASAVRADMSIGDKEFQGPTPYYNLSGKLVRTQLKYHG